MKNYLETTGEKKVGDSKELLGLTKASSIKL